MSKLKDFYLNNRKDVFKPIVVLFTICIVIPLALAVTNYYTKDKIAVLTAKNEKASMKELVKADSYKEAEFNYYGTGIAFNVAIKDNEELAYIFVTSEKGYGGDVSVMTAVGVDGKIVAVKVLDASNETPGLGQNTTKESFYSQYKEKYQKVSVVKNGADGANNEINAVTGATISSKAVTKAVNKALNYANYITSGGVGQ